MTKTIEVVAAVIRRPEDDDSQQFLVTKRGYGDLIGKWEFPGGKIEPEETREAAVIREIKEELDLDIAVEKFLTTVNYDYPDFHLTMHCFLCNATGEMQLLEHQASAWCKARELGEFDWCPADVEIVEKLQELFG